MSPEIIQNNLTSDEILIIKIDLSVNAQDLSCPMPLLKAKQALNLLEAGQVVEVLATDKGSYRDFHSFVNQSTHELLLAEESNGVFRYLLRKGQPKEFSITVS